MSVAISTVIVSYKLAIEEQVTLLLSVLFQENGDRDLVCVIICTDYFRMSFEKTLMQFNINEKQDLSLLLIDLLSNTSSVFLPYKYCDVN